MLGHIFLHYVTERLSITSISAFDAFDVFNYPSPRKAFRLTEICHHWRTVALTTPSIWSGVSCGCYDPMPPEHYLHLSKSHPLHAVIKGDLESGEHILATYPSRIQHLLMIDNISWSRRYDPRRFLTHVAPDLLTCTLDFHSWPRGPSLPELEYDLFGAGGPERLHSLSLHNTRIIPNDRFPNLRVLNLYDIAGIPNIPYILSLLERCPRIEEVCVHSNREPGRIPPSRYWGTVELRYARKVVFLIQNSVWLLAHLALPLSALVRVDDITLQELIGWPALPPPLGPVTEKLTRLRLSSPSGGPLRASIVGELRVELAGATPHAGYCLNITSPPAASPLDRYKAFANVLDKTDTRFAHITVLWVAHTSTAISPILSALPTLRLLGVLLLEDRTYIDLLADTLRAGDHGSLVCPSLSALCVYNLEYQHRKVFMQRLEEIAVSRAQSGHRLSRVALECDQTLRDSGGPLVPYFSAIRQHVDQFTVITRGRGAALGTTLPPEWREEWGDDGVWPGWDFFGGSRGIARGGF